MLEDERIDYLNSRIVTLNKKIKNMNTCNDVIGVFSGILIFAGIHIGYFSKLSKYYDNSVYPVVMLCSIGLSAIPSVNLPTYKMMKKKAYYHMEIKESLNELHQFALEEDKRFVKGKKVK